MNIEEFIERMAKAITAAQPAKLWDVNRLGKDGEVVQQKTSLAQVIAELTDILRVVATQNALILKQGEHFIKWHEELARQITKATEQLEQLDDTQTALLGEFQELRKALRRRKEVEGA